MVLHAEHTSQKRRPQLSPGCSVGQPWEAALGDLGTVFPGLTATAKMVSAVRAAALHNSWPLILVAGTKLIR